jgi:hypothetical protein
MGLCRYLHRELSTCYGPTWLYQQKQYICIKDQYKHFTSATNLSTTYKFYGPTHCSHVTENCIAYMPMWLNWPNIMANKMGPSRWLPKLASRLLQPMWIYQQEWHFCIKDQCEHFALATNLLPMDSVGPRIVFVWLRTVSPMGQCKSMGWIWW